MSDFTRVASFCCIWGEKEQRSILCRINISKPQLAKIWSSTRLYMRREKEQCSILSRNVQLAKTDLVLYSVWGRPQSARN